MGQLSPATMQEMRKAVLMRNLKFFGVLLIPALIAAYLYLPQLRFTTNKASAAVSIPNLVKEKEPGVYIGGQRQNSFPVDGFGDIWTEDNSAKVKLGEPYKIVVVSNYDDKFTKGQVVKAIPTNPWKSFQHSRGYKGSYVVRRSQEQLYLSFRAVEVGKTTVFEADKDQIGGAQPGLYTWLVSEGEGYMFELVK